MTFVCDWCGSATETAWEIPKARNRDKQFVCKQCHTDYFDGIRDAEGNRKAERVKEL